MRFEVVFLLLFGFIASTFSAPREGLPLLNPGGIGGIFEGPHSETIIVGPDGSEITSEQKGGAIIRDDGLSTQPIVVAEPEEVPQAAVIPEEVRFEPEGRIISSTGTPILDSPAATAFVSSSSPLLIGETYEQYERIPEVAHNVKPIEIIQQDPHVIETEIVEAPDVEPEQNSDLEGPSGRIITKGSASIVSGPASTTITEPRKIIVAPPKIAIGTPIIATSTIPLKEVSIAAPLPPIAASTLVPLPGISSSTIAPPILGYSSTAAPSDYGYSTTVAPLASNIEPVDSIRIDLGGNTVKQSIPLVEYSSSNGVINEPAFFNAGTTYSSTEAPVLSSTISSITSEGPASPSRYLLPPAEHTYAQPTASGLISSTDSRNIQKIPRINHSISVNGRVGDLSQNEILSYDSRSQYSSSPDLSRTKYIGPALARNGIDGSQINLAEVPLSQVIRLEDNGAYDRGGYDTFQGYRYGRSSDKEKNK